MNPLNRPSSIYPDPNDKDCRTCKFWDGDRSWPTDENWEGRCSVLISGIFPPYFSKALEELSGEPITKATERCSFHEYQQRPF